MPNAAAQPVLKSDQRLAQRAKAVRSELQEADQTAASLADRKAGAMLRKRCADTSRALAVLDEATDPRAAARELDRLARASAALLEEVASLEVQQLANAMFRRLWDQAQALLKAIDGEIQAIGQPSAGAPIVRERDALKAVLARADADTNADRRMAAYRACLPKLEALESRAGVVARFAEWFDAVYVAQHRRTLADIARCPAERCRRSLQAAMDLIGEAVKRKLAASDMRGVENVGVRPLQQLARLAVRVSAASPAIERELVRIGRRLAQLGAPAAETAELRTLVQQKKTAWPDAAEPSGIERAVTAFEASVARLAERIERLPTAKLVKP